MWSTGGGLLHKYLPHNARHDSHTIMTSYLWTSSMAVSVPRSGLGSDSLSPSTTACMAGHSCLRELITLGARRAFVCNIRAKHQRSKFDAMATLRQYTCFE